MKAARPHWSSLSPISMPSLQTGGRCQVCTDEMLPSGTAQALPRQEHSRASCLCVCEDSLEGFPGWVGSAAHAARLREKGQEGVRVHLAGGKARADPSAPREVTT